MSEIILASQSPRRRELLAQITPNFLVEPSLFEEKAGGLSAKETVLAFARGKAAEVASRHPQDIVIGADTVVVLNGEILGKPKDGADAARMLRALSGRTHSVCTGVCILGHGAEKTRVVETLVTFFDLSEQFIQEYVAGGSPLDKAGAYGIQDGGLVEKYEGSYTNVVGLPVEEVRAMLAEILGGNQC